VIRTVLIDDEPDSIKILQKLLGNYCPQIEVVGTADGVETATTLIHAARPDLVFLDIEMMQGNAFDLLNRLQPINFQVIFVTAFDNYAVRAFKYSAMDYLLKPLDINRLVAAVEKISGRFEKENVLAQMKLLLENLGNISLSDQKIAIPTLTGLSFVALGDIIRLEAKGGYTAICTIDKQQILATRTIKDYEDILPPNIFYRIHNSHIINLQKIKKYQKGRGGSVIMEDNSDIEVAVRRRDEFISRLLK
jgi:two-component system, LytTR family, response regulator